MIMFKNKENVSYEIKNTNVVINFLKKVKKNTIEEKMLFNEYNFLVNNTSIHFPKVLDFHNKDEYSVLELEFVEGIKINKNNISSIKDKLNLLCELLDIIKIIHSKGFVHCDINPNNILITNKKEIKLIDFGLICKIGSKNCFNFGTLKYVSKEQLNSQALDERTDIYSIGIFMLDYIFNFDLYSGKNKNEIIMLKNDISYFDIKTILKIDKHNNLINIINKCIQNNIDLRYKNVDDLSNDIKMFLEGDINE